MDTTGIRILDKENHWVSVELEEILEEIDGKKYIWSILYFYGMGKFEKWDSLDQFETAVNDSEKGLVLKWSELKGMSKQFGEIYDVLIIECENDRFIKRYEDDEMMYRNCNFVINKFDSSYWEVFSSEKSIIKCFSKKFKEVKFLEPDFLSKES